jgi:ASC-1-like (ASCH) protein
MKIVKKVQEEYFKAITEGEKRFELRLADFKCKPGDTLVLIEQKQGTKEPTGREAEFEILYNLNTKIMNKFHTKEEIEKYGFLVLSIRKKFNRKK